MDTQQALHTRVSAPVLTDPVPDAKVLENIYKAALRAPDHLVLRPWRFLLVRGEARSRLGKLFAFAAAQSHGSLAEAPRNMRLAAAVGAFAEILRESPHLGVVDLIKIQAEIEAILNLDSDSERELLNLVKAAQLLK